MWIAVVAALGSALLVAVASVLQHRAGVDDPNPSFGGILRSPLWIAGSASGIFGFLLHAAALSAGNLSLVQPLLVSGLLFALPLSSALDHRRPRRQEVLAAAAVVAGLAAFQLAANPAATNNPARLHALMWCSVVVTLLALSPVVLTRRTSPRRAVWLGLSAGIAYGLTAALLKATIETLTHAPGHLVTSWPAYAFVITVSGAIIVNQLAFNAGPLAHSLPLVTIVDPVVAIVIGAVAFGEMTSTSPSSVIVQLAGMTTMALGVAALTRVSAAAEVAPKPAQAVAA